MKGSYDLEASHHPRINVSFVKLLIKMAEKDVKCFFFVSAGLGLREAGAVDGYIISNVVDLNGVPFSIVFDCKKVVFTIVEYANISSTAVDDVTDGEVDFSGFTANEVRLSLLFLAKDGANGSN